MSIISATPSSALLASKPRVPQHVVFRSFAAETVLLNLNTGQYHGLNETGGRMFEALSSATTVGAAGARVARDYNVPADLVEPDLCVLCSDLVDRDLLTLESAT